MQILFEDYYLIAVNKSAGLSVESGDGRHPSLEQEALMYFTAELNKKSSSNRLKATPYLRAAHRLDRPVSGVTIFAKTKTTLTHLMQQFENRETVKTYLAITPNVPTTDTGTLTHWLGRDPSGKKALVFDKPKKGVQQAELRWQILEKNWKGALLELNPTTGRFHQIRAQLAHVGCPIFGDETYGGRVWKEYQIKLHASKLRFRHPKTNDWMEVEAPLPETW